MSKSDILQTLLDHIACTRGTDIASSSGSSGAIVVPEGYTLKHLEGLKPFPDRFRARVSTSSVQDFIAYLSENAVEGATLVFIAAEKGEAKAIIDAGTPSTPSWGSHKVSLNLIQSSAFKSLGAHSGVWHSQKDFIEFLEDWDENISFLYDAEGDSPQDNSFAVGLKVFKRLKATRAAEATAEVANHSSSGSMFDSMHISSAGKELPIGFMFNCDMFQGYGNVTLLCRLQSRVNGSEISLSYSIKSLERAKEEVSDMLYAELSEMIENASVYKGQIAYQE